MTDSHDHISVFEALSCLGDLPLNLLSELIKCLKSERFPAHQVIFAEGDTSEKVYFVGSGRLAKWQDGQFVERLSRGEMIGWDSFFHDCPRSHAVMAENDCYLYALNKPDMDRLVKQHPILLGGFLTASTPVPSTSQKAAPVELNKQVGVLTFDDLADEVQRVFERLTDCYTDHNKVASYNASEFNQLAGIKGSKADLFGALAADVFAHLESEHQIVFYTASANDSRAWLQKIVAQVDALIVMVRDTTETLPDWFIAYLKKSNKNPGLVIIRTQAGDFDQRVLKLWDVLQPEWHYRLHIDDQRRWGSVARMAIGQAVNLVLSGGGCLGAIHCGILKSLVDADFPIDTIGGTSAGGGIAIGYAQGHTPEVVAQKFRYAFKTKKPFKAYTIPFYGLVNPKRLDLALQEIAEGQLMQESHIPTYVTATNLTRSKAEVLTTGPTWEAMRITGSLPGVLPAYVKNGCAYIDGGVVNNFPVSVARQRFSGRYVGVTFNTPQDDLITSEYQNMPNALEAMLEKFKLGQTNDFPGLGKILVSSLMLSSSSELRAAVNRVDLLLNPPVPPGLGITSFEHFDELYELGVEYGKQFVSNLQSPNTIAELKVFGLQNTF